MPHTDPRLSPESRVPALITTLVVILAALVSGVRPGYTQGVRVPVGDGPAAGSIGVLNRWRTLDGNEDLYRSTIDLGSGPKLDHVTLRYREAEPGTGIRLLDSADIDLSSWGGEPSSTFLARWSRGHDYDASIRYRRLAYFNRIPSVANPSIGFSGAAQQWLDIDRGLFDAELTILPRRRVGGFVGISRDSAKGPGRTTYVVDANEYSVNSATDTFNNTFRGGIRIRSDRWTAHLEAGVSRFDDSQALAFEGGTTGNRTALFLGQRLRLTDLDQRYRVRGTDRFARARIEARPWSPLTLFGQFSFSQPTTDAD